MEQTTFKGLFLPFRRLAQRKPNANRLLFFATLFAMILANSPWADFYQGFLAHPITFQIGQISFFTHHGEPMTILEFVNDALMTLFFFVIGLEIKQEILIGELSSVRKAMLPVLAACGGMIVPVLVFLTVCNTNPEMRGAAIPMSTDIAFALAVISSLGNRVPVGLKIFLTALAVVDDIGGILVIALFYSQGVEWMPLLISFGLLFLLFAGNKAKIQARVFYYIGGFIIWLLFLRSGIHPTIAGVLVAFTIPANPKLDMEHFTEQLNGYLRMVNYDGIKKTDKAYILTSSQIRILNEVHLVANRSISPLQRMADGLHPWIYLFVLPLFAFVNAGVTFDTIQWSTLAGIPLAIFLGLFIGKTVGIYLFTILSVKLRLVILPAGINKRSLLGVSMLGGIGFTVALFISNLAYGPLPEIGADLLNQAKLGVFAGSIVSGVIGYYILRTSENVGPGLTDATKEPVSETK